MTTRVDLRVETIGPERASELLGVVHEAFASRPLLDPPATATDETVETVRAALADHGGLLVLDGEGPVAGLMFESVGDWLGLRRVGVLPRTRGAGVGEVLVSAAEQHARDHGFVGVRLVARAELPNTVTFWERQGYQEASRDGTSLRMRKRLPFTVRLRKAESTRELGRWLAGAARPGDVVILTGGLGAGKTTFAQGLGEGLGARGPVTSPTFVISRVHHGNPPLVHVDAYRLHDAAELDDLDLDTDLVDAVTVVEWGEGLAEMLSRDRVTIDLTADPVSEERTAAVSFSGARWVVADPALHPPSLDPSPTGL